MNGDKIYTGVLLGAAAGAAVALMDKTTRRKLNRQLKSLNYYKNRPSEAARDFREYYEHTSERVMKKAEDIQNILSQVEETIEMVNRLTGKKPSGSSDKTSSNSNN